MLKYVLILSCCEQYHNLKTRIESLFSYSRRHLQEQEDTLKKLMENRQIQQMKELETLFEKYVKLHATIFFIQVISSLFKT